MRKTLMALAIFMTLNAASTHFPANASVQQGIPSYAKWGQIAMKETQSKYPNASIIDYLHEGSDSKGELTIEKFKLWLKDGDVEFGVFVRIKFNTETEEVVTIKFEETTR